MASSAIKWLHVGAGGIKRERRESKEKRSGSAKDAAAHGGENKGERKTAATRNIFLTFIADGIFSTSTSSCLSRPFVVKAARENLGHAAA